MSLFPQARYVFIGTWRRLWLRLRGMEPVVAGGCRMCGSCCKGLNLTLGGSWVRSEQVFARMRRKHSEYEHFEITGRTPDGVLIFRCTMQDENGLCTIHATRPKICREYPTPDIYFMGGEIRKHCGFSFVPAKPFKPMLKKKMK